jgi:hypothetical protein
VPFRTSLGGSFCLVEPTQREATFAPIADKLERAIAERFGGATRAA